MILKFKNKEAYRRWNAYRFIHGVAKGGHEQVYLHGKKHHVHHALRVSHHHKRK